MALNRRAGRRPARLLSGVLLPRLPRGGEADCDPKRTFSASFDHLVSKREERRWHIEAERLGGRQIDDQLEFCRLLNRDIVRACPVQNLIDNFGGTSEQIRSLVHRT